MHASDGDSEAGESSLSSNKLDDSQASATEKQQIVRQEK